MNRQLIKKGDLIRITYYTNLESEEYICLALEDESENSNFLKTLYKNKIRDFVIKLFPESRIKMKTEILSS